VLFFHIIDARCYYSRWRGQIGLFAIKDYMRFLFILHRPLSGINLTINKTLWPEPRVGFPFQYFNSERPLSFTYWRWETKLKIDFQFFLSANFRLSETVS